MKDHPLILVVNMDSQIAQLMEDVFHDEGYSTYSIEEASRAFPIIKDTQPQLVMMMSPAIDINSSWRILKQMCRDSQACHIPVIVIYSIPRSIERIKKDIQPLVCDTLRMPFDLNILLSMVAKHVAA